MPEPTRAQRLQAQLAAATAAQLARLGCAPPTAAETPTARRLAKLVVQGAAGDRVDRDAVAVAVRSLLLDLAKDHPGQAVELRVPPYAAVQLGFGQGPAHTRGTPPNVVETDPLTFLRLATGSLSWAAARSAGHLQASGAHSDLSELFPL